MKCVVRVSCSVALTLCVAHQATAGWFDSATGQPVQTIPLTSDPNNPTGNVRRDDPDHATVGGKNLFWRPCPPPETAASTGLYLGGELAKSWGHVRSTERLAATDVITSQFSDSADPLGGGIIVGYKFAPWANNII